MSTGGFEYTDDEFENFARSSEMRKIEFDSIHERLSTTTDLSGAPFGHMPWSGAIEGAYTSARTELLDATESASEAMQVIAENIRLTRDHYTASETENLTNFDKMGEEG